MSTGPSSKCLFLAFAVLEGCESTFGGKGNEIWFDSSIIVKLVRDEERVSSRGIAPRKKKRATTDTLVGSLFELAYLC